MQPRALPTLLKVAVLSLPLSRRSLWCIGRFGRVGVVGFYAREERVRVWACVIVPEEAWGDVGE